MSWLRRLPGALWFFARGFVTSIAGNITLAILATALAFALWLFVTEAENPTERQTFNSAIEITFVNVPDELAVANTSATTVRIDIEAPENDIEDLRAQDFVAEANLGGLTTGESSVPVAVRSTKSDVRIVRIAPEQVTVDLEALSTKDVPVRVKVTGSPREGFAEGETTVSPQTATVSGPQSLVDLVEAAYADVVLSGNRVDFTADRVPLRPRDAREGEIGRVTVSPETANVTVAIEQQEFSLEFLVSPDISGRPAPGYNVAAVVVDPPIVTLTGPLDVLDSIDAVAGVSTAEVAIGDARATVTHTADLVLPTGVGVIGSNQVRVTVTIEPAEGEISFLVVPQVRNVAEGLVVTQASPLFVTLAGDVPTLQTLTPESIVAVADAQGLGPGLYSLPLTVTPPPGTSIVRVEPPELGVALVERP